MYYVLRDGRVLGDKTPITNEDYLELDEYPATITANGLIGYVSGFSNGKVTYNFVQPNNPPNPEIIKTNKTSEIEILIQAIANTESKNMEIQRGQQLIAQKLTDIELSILGGN